MPAKTVPVHVADSFVLYVQSKGGLTELDERDGWGEAAKEYSLQLTPTEARSMYVKSTGLADVSRKRRKPSTAHRGTHQKRMRRARRATSVEGHSSDEFSWTEEQDGCESSSSDANSTSSASPCSWEPQITAVIDRRAARHSADGSECEYEYECEFEEAEGVVAPTTVWVRDINLVSEREQRLVERLHARSAAAFDAENDTDESETNDSDGSGDRDGERGAEKEQRDAQEHQEQGDHDVAHEQGEEILGVLPIDGQVRLLVQYREQTCCVRNGNRQMSQTVSNRETSACLHVLREGTCGE